jgi:outer membrane receptor protein involved in Fe transport
MIRKLLSVTLLFVSIALSAQTRPGSLRGVVKDKATGETMPFANVTIKQGGVLVTGGTTDLDGNYNINPVDPGIYTVECSFAGYATVKISNIQVYANKAKVLNFQLEEASEMLQEVEVVAQTELIETGKTSDIVDAEEIKNLPYRNIGQIVSTTPGVYQSDEGQGVNFRGARSGNNQVFIDGVKVRGDVNIPRDAILQTEVITGGTPAQYGDVTGGVISTTTKGPTPYYFGSAEVLTSSPFDQYHYNLGALTVGGPILKKKNPKTGERDGPPLIGFLVAGEFQYDRDPFPRALPNYIVKDDVRQGLEQNPLVPSAVGSGVLQAGEFLTNSDLTTLKYRPNAQRTQVRINGNLKFQTSKNTTLMVGGRYNRSQGNAFTRFQSLMNFDNNREFVDNDWTILARFTQRFGTGMADTSSSSIISNAFYSIQVDYTRNTRVTWDPRFEQNYFQYGHVGRFQTNQRRLYLPGSDTITDPNDPNFGNVLSGWTHVVWQDVGVDFTPGTSNPILANYTSAYYNFVDQNLINNNTSDLESIRGGGGLLNGDSPRTIYGLWGNVGAVHGGYGESRNSQFRVTANTTFDIKNHSLILGLEYEQRVDRSFGVGATGIWTLMRLLQNDAIRQLDLSNPIPVYDENGVFQDTLNYNRLFDAEKPRTFDRNVRRKLGLDENGTDWLDIDSYDPGFFSLDMFSANELLNIGSTQYVAYNGYDYTGQILQSNPSLADFYAEDAQGNSDRLIGAFQPIYLAGYIQDQFTFNDLFFNIGVRFDRFDANQPVLRDPWVLYPAFTVGDLSGTSLAGAEIPAGMGDDFVVYVDNFENPTRIVGYRDGEIWYDQNGNLEDNPKRIADESGGGITPFLKQPEVENQTLAVTYNESFVDYTPQWTVSPRISFQFPISDEAEFFAHYDLMVQRPDPALGRFNPIDYLQLENGTGGILPNPNLLPQKTTDYEIGFRQKLGSNSALKISAFYREMRDMMQQTAIVEAFPLQYVTYGNIDFGTVKGFTFSYDLRRTGNVRINANYTLQFADGSGSGPNTGANLARSGLPNLRYILPLSYDARHQVVVSLDYRFGEGRAYNGPVIGNSNILENFGINLVVNGNSGTPYTRRVQAYSITAGAASVPITGQVNGSRLPFQTRLDMTINKIWTYKYGENKRNGSFEVYFQILNLLDTRNVLGVYPFTGSPDDDGYLSSPQGQGAINFQTNAQSYVDLYNARMANPNFYTLPRRIRLGIRVGF